MFLITLPSDKSLLVNRKYQKQLMKILWEGKLLYTMRVVRLNWWYYQKSSKQETRLMDSRTLKFYWMFCLCCLVLNHLLNTVTDLTVYVYYFFFYCVKNSLRIKGVSFTAASQLEVMLCLQETFREDWDMLVVTSQADVACSE